jgi:NitT/TauT family transport system ATP-binding protein
MAVKVEAIGVTKRFPTRGKGNAIIALRDFTLSVHDAEFLAIVGPSGCGKSTFLNAVAGLEPIDEGRLLMDGRPITKAGADRGMCFQDFALFPWLSVRENVEFGLEAQGRPRAERRRISRHYIDLVQLTGFEDRYPWELSGGMKQRCALARLVAGDPAVFLMDEPLASLDAQTRLILQNEILRIWGEDRPAATRKTVIFVTHSIDEAVFLADRIAVTTSRPGQVKEIVENSLPRPREDRLRGEPRFSRLTMDIWELVRDAAVKAIAT